VATLAESLVSSTSRPLLLRARPDLTARKHRYHGSTFWVVKEPVGLNYFRFHEEEYAILQMLDGRTSLEEIKEQFEQQFQPQKITYHDLLQFVGMLHRSGLVISEAGGQGKQLVKRRNEKKWREWMGKLSNVFALRFRGIDPERFLNWLYKYAGWFFTWPAVLCVMLIGLAALTLVTVNFDVFQSRLPAFHEFFGPKNWFWLGITMAVVKVLHEFGHGLSCKHFGGECHELGAMLLVLTPALYCNVSDSWMLPNKCHRAAIGAAGMYVELFLASIATFLWWFSSPGLLNHICLSVMFICSVSTVIFNGNPLLRFDGYYILMDLLEIPNLRQKSSEILKRYMKEWCLGLEQPENPFLPQGNRWLFAVYTVAAVAYRWLVTFSILLFLNSVFEPYGLKVIGQAIAMAGLIGLVVQPLWALWKFLYTPGSLTKVKKNRVFATIGVLAAALLFVLFVPLPFSVKCVFEVQPRGGKQVFAGVAGELTEIKAKAGDQVEQGDVILVMENLKLRWELQSLIGRRDEARQALADLQRARFSDPAAGDQIEQAQETLAAAEKQVADKQLEVNRLTVVAPRAGVIIPVPQKVDKTAQAEGRLAGWSGSPFDGKNLSAWFQPTDLLCQVGDPRDLEVVLIIDQTYIGLVQPEHPVRVLLEAETGRAFDTAIDKISPSDVKLISPAMATQNQGRLEAKTDPSGMMKPLSTSFEARAPLNEAVTAAQVGMQGQARVYTGWQSVRSRLYRYLAKTFHFDL
jgi:putative peptide zinc metalloprotease protein